MKRRTFLAATTAMGATALLPRLALAQAAASNPVAAPWSGPHGGAPAFDQIKVEHFAPALQSGIGEALAATRAVTVVRSAPTVKTVLEPLERSQRTLDRASTLYGVWAGTLSTPEFRAVEKEMDPKLAALDDQIRQDPLLYQKIKTVYDRRQHGGLTPEQQRLAWFYWSTFRRAGAELDPAAKARVAQINQKLSGLFAHFRDNLLGDEETFIELSDADMAGLPDSVRQACVASAKDLEIKAAGAVVNTRSSVEPFLSFSPNRPMRQKVWAAFTNRGDNGDSRDNNGLIKQILKLRAERAKLLGYPTHAHWRLEVAMAKTPDAAMDLMMKVWGPAKARVAEEVADMQAIADAEPEKITIEPWDYRYYAEKVRAKKYALDMDAVKPYLQLEKLREGMFWAAGQLHGFTFTQVTDLPVAHPDIRVWEVTGEGGARVGLWYFDPFARPGKRSGAWMNAYRPEEHFEAPVTAIVSNTCNFVKTAPGEPVLVSWDDATTLFHEFGHALHALCSKAAYPSLSGTAVARDFVEFPSQLNEHWLPTKEVLSRFAVHYKTGEPLPQALLDKIRKAKTFNQGFITVEYLSSALIDMKLHLAGDADIDPRAFEQQALAELGMPRQIVMRHRTPQFQHVFAGDNYSAGYYSYLWADTLTADVAEAFEAAPGGYYDQSTAKRLRDTMLSKGNSVDPAEQFRAFRGRDPDTGALMRNRGFA